MSDAPARILIVEDDPLVAAVILELARDLGDARWVVSAERALRELSLERWDLLVSDIELRGISGLKLVDIARRACPSIATLMLTARGTVDDAAVPPRTDADDVMTKPIDASALIPKLDELIELARTRSHTTHRRVLAIGVHAADVEIGCGGTVRRHLAAGDDVTVLTLVADHTGSNGTGTRAALAPGATVLDAGLTETTASDGAPTVSAIRRVIDDLRPSTIYTHALSDVHADHRNVHRATLLAARSAACIYGYEAPSTTVDFHPTRFVPIDDFIDRKLEALDSRGATDVDADLLRATARYWSRFAECHYAEPLEVVRSGERHGEDPAR